MNLRSLSVFFLLSLSLLASCVNAVDEDGDGTAACVELPGFTVGPELICDPNDNNRNVSQDAEEVCDGIDNDLDGDIDEGFDTDEDGHFGANFPGCINAHGNDVDCDDDDPANFPGNPEICDNADNDCDGDVDNGLDRDGDGVTPCEETPDCDDDDPANFPGNDEICDNVDNDCDEVIDNDLDRDGDGFTPCALPTGDCNDNPLDERAPFVHPDADEICDGVADNNCDGEDDPAESDLDQDGETGCSDCDDNDPLRSFLFEEVCDEDAVDNDCDGLPDVMDPDTDVDGDEFSVCFNDCDDTNPEIHPDKNEVCNSFDDNCDGQTDEGFDQDFDTFTSCGGDCNDLDAAFNPNAPELCDGQDNDCNGQADVNGLGSEVDGDGDGWLQCEDCDDLDADANNDDADGDTFSTCGPDNLPNSGDEDCNDVLLDPFAADTYPGAPQLCDEVNNDCSDLAWPAVPSNEIDDDLDGELECQGDCDDNDPATYSTATPTCGGDTDNNCDGVTDAIDVSDDGDPETECQGDCDDTNNTIYSAAPELCDGLDNDCTGGPSGPEGDPDLDGYVACTIDVGGWDEPTTLPTGGDDCGPSDVTVFPTAPELCDGLDNDCTGGPSGPEGDPDLDGYVACTIDVGGWDEPTTLPTGGDDCSPGDVATYPTATPTCGGDTDNNCDGVTDAIDVDDDLDGQTDCDGDCDDNDPANYLGNTELCDGQDNDCNGLDDVLGYAGSEDDGDGDGQSDCQGDCDDNDPTQETLDQDGDTVTTCAGDCDDNPVNGNLASPLNSFETGGSWWCADMVDNDCDGSFDFADSDCPFTGCQPLNTTPSLVADPTFDGPLSWFEVASDEGGATFALESFGVPPGLAPGLSADNLTLGSFNTDESIGVTFSAVNGTYAVNFMARAVLAPTSEPVEVWIVDAAAPTVPLCSETFSLPNGWGSYEFSSCCSLSGSGTYQFVLNYGMVSSASSLRLDAIGIYPGL